MSDRWRKVLGRVTHHGNRRSKTGVEDSSRLLPPVVVPIISFNHEKPTFRLDSPEKWDAALLHFTSLIDRHRIRLAQLPGSGVTKRSKADDVELAQGYARAHFRLKRLHELEELLSNSDCDTTERSGTLERLAQRLKSIIDCASKHVAQE